ncbi:TetR/AcrR family transcriptional regulator [Streptomyces kunmingensis]|uniref:TetR/AcrR family transcriptional regulator n=1 Tax=Streptomyces kunmingensis TaxID=68225 RepID=A0ABU6C747_9ACTN|nr:TetR/AcrR family transcriptional regulator [Streptomyces kunmingensis]MEB3960539.1 TetR/AcrR family transcriptional regulator [Streptomyces kunmingensis]
MNKGLTAKGRATRQRIVVATALLTREKGAAETTLDDVRAATATSKSQLFHYFPEGRSDILTAVAEYEAGQVLDVQQPFLGDLSTWESWQKWRQAVLDHYIELGQRCPLGSLTTELGKSSAEARAILTTLFTEWEEALFLGVRTLTSAEPEAARIRARSILAAIQGGVVMLQATGVTDYLTAALMTSTDPLRPTAEGTD